MKRTRRGNFLFVTHSSQIHGTRICDLGNKTLQTETLSPKQQTRRLFFPVKQPDVAHIHVYTHIQILQKGSPLVCYFQESILLG